MRYISTMYIVAEERSINTHTHIHVYIYNNYIAYLRVYKVKVNITLLSPYAYMTMCAFKSIQIFGILCLSKFEVKSVFGLYLGNCQIADHCGMRMIWN